jgi:diacylglycerol kinase (ATP)
MMHKQGRDGLAHIPDAFVFSMQGLRAAWRNEIAFRLQSALLVPLIPLAVWMARSTLELVLLLGVCAVVLMAELFNSAIESIVDRISTELHPLSGQAKDLGSAGVFMSQTLFLIVWIPIAWGYIPP